MIAIAFLILLPFLSGEGEKSWKRRPVAVVTVLLTAVALGTFTRMAELLAVESRDGRVERRPRAGAISRRRDAARASRCTRLSGQTMPQLSFDWRFGRHARSRAGQGGDAGRPRTNSCAR